MAVQQYPYLAMTDGSTNVVFADGLGGLTSYPPVRSTWAPAIAGLRKSTLGGRGPYSDVTEELEINIRGVDAVTAMSNLEALARLLDQAERFWRLGQNVSPVLLKYAPQGSTIFSTANPAQCLVLGRASGDETAGVTLPTRFADVGMIFEIYGVRVRFIRSGLWLNATAETASSSAAANPTVQTATLTTNLNVSAPTKISVAVGALISVTFQFTILYASAANRLAIFEAESGLAGAQTTSVADAAALARGGNVARYTPPDTGLDPMIDLSISSMDSTIRRVAVYAAIRNNSATTTWLLQAHLQSSGVNFSAAPLIPVDVDTNTPKRPRIVFLGTLSTPVALSRLLISAQASAVSGTLDMDYIALVAVDDERSGAIVLANQAGTTPQEVDPRPLTAPAPLATVGGFASGYTGDGMIHTAGQAVYVTVLATIDGREFWRLVASGPVTVNNTLTVTRNNAYLSPR